MHCVNRQSSLGSWHTSFNICTVSTTNLPLDLDTLHSTYALCQPPIFPWILAHFIQHMHCVNRQSSLGSWHTSFNICTVLTTNLPLDLSTLHSTYALCQPPIFPWILAHFIQHMHCVNRQSSLGSWHTSFNIYALCQPPIFPWILAHFIQPLILEICPVILHF